MLFHDGPLAVQHWLCGVDSKYNALNDGLIHLPPRFSTLIIDRPVGYVKPGIAFSVVMSCPASSGLMFPKSKPDTVLDAIFSGQPGPVRHRL